MERFQVARVFKAKMAKSKGKGLEGQETHNVEDPEAKMVVATTQAATLTGEAAVEAAFSNPAAIGTKKRAPKSKTPKETAFEEPSEVPVKTKRKRRT